MEKKYNMYLSNGKKYIITKSAKDQVKEAKHLGIDMIEFADNLIFIPHVTHIEPQKQKRKKEEDTEMDLNQFIAYAHKSTQPHIQFIGDWAETTEPDFTKKSQWDVYIRRHMKAAAEVVKFKRADIEKAFVKIKKDSNNFTKFQPTIETIIKYLTH